MLPHQISEDLKAHILALYHEGYSVKDICHLLNIKKTLIYKVLGLYQQLDVVSNPYKYLFNQADLVFLSAIIEHQLCWCLPKAGSTGQCLYYFFQA